MLATTARPLAGIIAYDRFCAFLVLVESDWQIASQIATAAWCFRLVFGTLETRSDSEHWGTAHQRVVARGRAHAARATRATAPGVEYHQMFTA